ncbi:hypothetical protein MKS83_19415 [Chryseobacterium sp. Y16C]|uniref:hypothetical protein n=1 Tax=Chryseobacterium sp. Y16C TaxID=2920939 RepID=UPI001F0A6C4F|nr:hypothetical protein [Chryseobacterium sp. Y16C]UMQ41541.1 hypothetical protein MKS83_19415 [Chryseobacterium sp. Y16C]
MIKIITSIIAIYLLYYAGNVLYDLFLKKDSSKKTDETEEYSLAEFSEDNKNEVRKIEIDDVESINTPNSFNKKELFPANQVEKQDESRDLDYIRKKFESEQDIDDFYNVPEIQEKPNEKEQKETVSPDTQQEDIGQEQEKKEIPSPNLDALHKQFKNFLNLAETSVQVLSERNGYRVYQSMI